MKSACVLAVAALVASVEGHAYMANPLPRAQTIQGHQFSSDPQSDGTRNANCADGGKTGRITAEWTQGQEVTVEVAVTAFHGGYHQLRFCPEANGNNNCFEQHLAIAKPATSIYRGCPVAAPGSSADSGSCIPNQGCPSDNKDDCTMDLNGIGRYNFTFVLPPDLVCEHCAAQWWWGTNNYAPEHFKSCHDVRIVPSGPTEPPTPSPPTNPPTPSPPTPTPPVLPCSEFLTDVEFTGADLAVLASVTNEAECCEACNGSDECKAFTFVSASSGQWPTGCKLKSSLEQRARAGLISGVKDQGGEPPVDPEPPIDPEPPVDPEPPTDCLANWQVCSRTPDDCCSGVCSGNQCVPN